MSSLDAMIAVLAVSSLIAMIEVIAVINKQPNRRVGTSVAANVVPEYL